MKTKLEKAPDSEKRRVHRTPGSTERGFSVFLLSDSKKIEVDLIDFSSLGIGLSIEKCGQTAEELIANTKTVEILYGNKTIGKFENPVFAIKDGGKSLGLQNGGGIEHHRPMRKAARLSINPDFLPIVFATNPLDPNDSLHFKVVNLNSEGLLLKTSKRNRHIMAGMVLEGCQLVLPAMGMYKMSLEVRHAKVDETHLYFGVKIVSPSRELLQSLGQFALFGTSAGAPTEGGQFYNQIKSIGFSFKRLTKAISLQLVTSSEQMSGALFVRHKAYLAANKLDSNTRQEDMLDEFDANSFVYVLSLKGHYVATFRMCYSKKTSEKFPFEKYFPFPTNLGIEREDAYEVSRLAVLPEFQNTDAVIRIFQEVAKQGVLGREYLLMVATNNLRDMYYKLGATKVTDEISHPVLKDEKMALLALKTSDYINGRKIRQMSWNLVVKEIGEHLWKSGLIDKPKISPYAGILLSIEKFLIKFLRKKPKKS